tara:strand:+ start:4781 stop:5689 length:909 start_codon:yes stop_codon:yes gene_type:complete
MKKLDLSIIIPTRNRSAMLAKTIKELAKNKFFFKEIIIVDSSNKYHKSKIKNLRNIYKIIIKIFNSKPSISLQRNIGLGKVIKKRKYVMFLDDDLSFNKNAFKKMYLFIKNNNQLTGYGFNLNIKKINYFIEFFKKNNLTKILGIYDTKMGVITPSGWQTKAINLKKNLEVEWLPTQAVIYNKTRLKNLKFDTVYGSYSYLEDLDFSYSLSRKNKLMICSSAKYTSKNVVNRNDYHFGIKEIINRYYFVNKFNLNKKYFFLGFLFSFLKNFLTLLTLKPKFFLRIIGNFVAILKIIFGLRDN